MEAGLEVVPLSIISDDGTHQFGVEIARTDEQQTRGLMFRDRLAPDRGTILTFSPPRPVSFWIRKPYGPQPATPTHWNAE